MLSGSHDEAVFNKSKTVVIQLSHYSIISYLHPQPKITSEDSHALYQNYFYSFLFPYPWFAHRRYDLYHESDLQRHNNTRQAVKSTRHKNALAKGQFRGLVAR